MNGTTVAIVVSVFIAMDLCIAPLIIGAIVDGNWNPMAEKYPPMAPQPGAVRRNFQSFSVGSLNLGGCIHAAADASYLHLYPSWFARRLRARAASIPWDKLELVATRGKYAVVRIPELSALRVRGPRWCLELAPPSTHSGSVTV